MPTISQYGGTIRYSLWAFALAAFLFGCSSKENRAEPAKEKQDDSPRPTGTASNKLLLFGLDGATWTLIDPLIAQGKLPNFKNLIDKGARAPLESIKPSVSPLLWTTIATGVGHEKHGINWFIVSTPKTDEALLPTSNMRKVKAIWNIISAEGKEVGVIGWWASYPAERVNGFIISDQASIIRRESYLAAYGKKGNWADHVAKGETFPPELIGEIADSIRHPYEIDEASVERFLKLPPKRLSELANEKVVDIQDIFSVFKIAFIIDKSFIEAGLYELSKHRPDFTAVYLNGLDAVEHHFWKFMEPSKFKDVDRDEIERYGGAIEQYYVYMDEVLGRFLDLYGREDLTAILVSDHGHQANPFYDPKSEDHFNRYCSGTHDEAPDGILIMSGKDIAKGAKMGRATIFDIAPTVLALMGAPVGSDMPGRVLKEAIEPSFLLSHPVSHVPTHSKDHPSSDVPVRSNVGDVLKEKLKGLGYVK